MIGRHIRYSARGELRGNDLTTEGVCVGIFVAEEGRIIIAIRLDSGEVMLRNWHGGARVFDLDHQLPTSAQ